MRPCVLITGGAGFIGYHAAKHFLNNNWQVVLIDNLSRPGVENNLKELQALGQPLFIKADIRKKNLFPRLFQRVPRVDLLLHLAAQVAVTKSVENPREDLEVNFLATFELLEACRKLSKNKKPRLMIFSSTNKVYGDLSKHRLKANETRYKFLGGKEAISEDDVLDFHSPYGCSKGAADQYVHDYSRIYGLPTVVLRQSCIYGVQQYGIEDQGWVAYFAIRALLDKPITIYGDGKQVRDILYVDDLVRLFDLLYRESDVSRGKIYTVGGGPEHTLSLFELVQLLEKKLKKKIKLKFAPWRPGDQRIFVADITSLENNLGWYPQISIDAGLDRTLSWIKAHLAQIKAVKDAGRKVW